MNQAYFQKIPEHLRSYLSEAKYSICIAVCWFTHKDIFEVLLDRLRSGIQIDLLIEYDSQNIREGGLDFQRFIRAGGQLWACREQGLMHHKFSIVDQQLLLTGSFNWTYNTNAENILVTNDERCIRAYKEEFDRQKATSKRIFQICSSDVKVFAAFPLFEKTQYPMTELRKKVSLGSKVWLIRLDKLKIERSIIFSENKIPFDAKNVLASFWSTFRTWDEELFEEEMERLKPEFSGTLLRDVQCWARRMKIGDLVFAVTRNAVPENSVRRNAVPETAICRNSVPAYLLAVGIIQSHPQPLVAEEFSSFREVQWLKMMEGKPYLLPEKTSGQKVAKYGGSAFRVLQEIFG